jgi:hypothetical protein
VACCYVGMNIVNRTIWFESRMGIPGSNGAELSVIPFTFGFHVSGVFHGRLGGSPAHRVLGTSMNDLVSGG